MLPVAVVAAVACFCSGDVAMRCVLPVLWMTLYFLQLALWATSISLQRRRCSIMRRRPRLYESIVQGLPGVKPAMHLCRVCLFVCVFVCLSDCLSVRERISGTTCSIYSKFLYLLSVAWSFSCGVAIRYVLPVLWMTSFLHIIAWNRRRKKSVYLKWFNRGQHVSTDLTARRMLQQGHLWAGGGVWCRRLPCCGCSHSSETWSRLVPSYSSTDLRPPVCSEKASTCRPRVTAFSTSSITGARCVDYSDCAIGTESVPKIIINNRIIFFLKLQSAFC